MTCGVSGGRSCTRAFVGASPSGAGSPVTARSVETDCTREPCHGTHGSSHVCRRGVHERPLHMVEAPLAHLPSGPARERGVGRVRGVGNASVTCGGQRGGDGHRLLGHRMPADHHCPRAGRGHRPLLHPAPAGRLDDFPEGRERPVSGWLPVGEGEQGEVLVRACRGAVGGRGRGRVGAGGPGDRVACPGSPQAGSVPLGWTHARTHQRAWVSPDGQGPGFEPTSVRVRLRVTRAATDRETSGCVSSGLPVGPFHVKQQDRSSGVSTVAEGSMRRGRSAPEELFRRCRYDDWCRKRGWYRRHSCRCWEVAPCPGACTARWTAFAHTCSPSIAST